MVDKAKAQYQDTKQDLVVKDFKGVNLQAARTAIAEDEFSWLENLFPVGFANLPVVMHQGSAVATIAGVSINYWKYVNINNTDYLMAATAAGALYAINLSTYAVTNVIVAGTLSGTVSVAQWKNERVLIIDSSNYRDWNGTTVSNNGSVTGAPSAGQTIATFAGRVWIGNARTVSYSAPNSYTDFTGASAGGSFIITDETLHSNINSLFTANNFLYIFGESSINVVSDVRTTGSPAVTVFSNTNVSALIGSNLPLSIFPFGRNVAFATKYGFYELIGATPSKISDNLDNLIPLINFANPVSGDVANLYSKLMPCFCFTYNDPVAGARPLMALFYNKKWFFASQGSGITIITGGFQSGVPAIFGTDGTNIWKLFSNAANSITWKFSTALWPVKAHPQMKQALKAGIEVTTGSVVTGLSLTVDSERSSIPYTITAQNTGQWINSAGLLGNWVNSSGATDGWIVRGFQIYQTDIEQFGRYIGYDVTSTAPAAAINGVLLQYEKRGNWTGRPN